MTNPDTHRHTGVQSAPRIIVAQPRDADRLGSILGDAFAQDPVMNWAIPNVELYESFFRQMARQLFIPHQQAYLDDRNRGAAMWLPPNVHYDIPLGLSQALLWLRLILSRGPGVIKRLLALQATMAEFHPRTPHYYLQTIGARQAHQGQGIGSTLLKQVTPLCDRDRVPAYLESSSEKNVPLYERHGFEVFHEQSLGSDGPSMWLMLRQPR